VREIYAEDVKMESSSNGSNLRLLIVPQEDKTSKRTSMEKVGIGYFKLWPRECILGLLEYSLEDLIAEESHTDPNTGLVTRKAYRVNPDAKSLVGSRGIFWWSWFPWGVRQGL
jgi:hypothetical protein